MISLSVVMRNLYAFPLAVVAALLDRLGCYEPAATIAGFAFRTELERPQFK